MSGIPAIPCLAIDTPAPADAEAALIARAKADPSAFSAIYRAHYTPVVAYLYRRVGDAHTAEDLAAETFIRALRAIGRYRAEGLPLRSWLLRIATNEAHRWARRRRRHRSAVPPDIAADGDPQAPRRAVVQDAFLALRPGEQDVLALHHLAGLEVAQVARVLGCREGTVKSRLSRAREALRAELERREHDD